MNIALIVPQPQTGADGPILHRLLRGPVQAHRLRHQCHGAYGGGGHRLPVNLFLSHEHGGIEQIGQRIIYNEIDMVLFFNYPKDTDMDDSVMYISRLCDEHSVPMATNVATAELLIHGLARGDLDWRIGMNPNRVPFAL